MHISNDGALGAVIKVVGVGGGGGNAIRTMITGGLSGVDFIAANTDVQNLVGHPSPVHIQLGSQLTKGLGAGANPEVGRQAALESRERIADVLKGADMVFVTAGMGGGTGTGAAPIIAQLARDCGVLCVAVVTTPFNFEGQRRMRQAKEGIEALRGAVDAYIIVQNQRLLEIAPADMKLTDAFKYCDDVVLNAVQGISDLITVEGLINVDFADVKAILKEQGQSVLGTGSATGPSRALEAAKRAVESPLLNEVSIKGATGILINITGGADMTLTEVGDANEYIHGLAHEDANIIFGSVVQPNLGDRLKVTVVATGFEQRGKPSRPRSGFELAVQQTLPSRPRPTSPTIPGRPVPPAPPRGTLDDYASRPVRHITQEEALQQENRRSTEHGRTPAALGASGLDEDVYEIPTYQRKDLLTNR